MRPITLLFLLLFSVGYAQYKPSDIDILLFPYEKPGAPGVAVGIVKNGRLVYEKYTGLEDIKAGRHASKKTMYNLASDSKRFTAACIVLLAQQDKLSLTDPISKYFPELPDYAKTITINHLLNHTSGLKDYLVLAMYKGLRDTDYTNKDVINWLARQEPDFKPGEKFSYSNTGYLLLQQITEQVSGKSIDKFAAQHIFRLLKMKSTIYARDTKTFLNNKAKGYSLSDTIYKEEIQDVKVIGGAGVYATVHDIALWLAEMKSKKILGADFWDILLNEGRTKTKNLEYSKGHFIYKRNGIETIDHGGDSDGFHSNITYLPEKDLGIIVLANHDTINAGGLTREIIDTYSGNKKPVTVAVAKEKPVTIDIEDNVLQQYAGRYEMEPGSNVLVTLTDKVLYVTQQWDGVKYPITPVSNTSFVFLEQPDVVFEFNEIKDDLAQQLIITQNGEQYSCNRIEDSAILNKDYTGTYYCKSLDVNFRIFEEDNTLKCDINLDEPFEMVNNEKDIFITNAGAIAFNRHESGQITGFILSHARAKNFVFKKV